MSSLLNKTLNIDNRTYTKDDVKSTSKNDDTMDSDDNYDINESNEIPPERDLRDPQPTISNIGLLKIMDKKNQR